MKIQCQEMVVLPDKSKRLCRQPAGQGKSFCFHHDSEAIAARAAARKAKLEEVSK